MGERFLIRTEGGPCDGQMRAANSDGPGEWAWPLPDVLKYDATGSYVKCAESGWPSPPEGSHRVRGATYRWTPNEPSPCQCPCSCWSAGHEGLCDACRMGIHASDRARPRPVVVKDGDDA